MLLDFEKNILIAFVCIVIYLYITFVLSKSYKKRFDQNFLFAKGSLIDFPLILCFLIFWLGLYGVSDEPEWWERDLEKVGNEEFGINNRNTYSPNRYSHCWVLATCSDIENVNAYILEQMGNQWDGDLGYKVMRASSSEDCSDASSYAYDRRKRPNEPIATCEQVYLGIVDEWKKVVDNPSEYFMPEGHMLNPLNYKSGLAKILIAISLASMLLLLIINISKSSFLWGIIQTIFKVPLMGALSGIMIASIFVGGASIAKKRAEKKELGKKISKGIANSKKKKF